MALWELGKMKKNIRKATTRLTLLVQELLPMI